MCVFNVLILVFTRSTFVTRIWRRVIVVRGEQSNRSLSDNGAHEK